MEWSGVEWRAENNAVFCRCPNANKVAARKNEINNRNQRKKYENVYSWLYMKRNET